MILNYSSKEQIQTAATMDAWMAKLSEGKKSIQQLQTEMLQSTADTVKEIQDKAIESSKEAAKEDGTKSEGETTASSQKNDEIKAPSEVTKADLESPIDIKL